MQTRPSLFRCLMLLPTDRINWDENRESFFCTVIRPLALKLKKYCFVGWRYFQARWIPITGFFRSRFIRKKFKKYYHESSLRQLFQESNCKFNVAQCLNSLLERYIIESRIAFACFVFSPPPGSRPLDAWRLLQWSVAAKKQQYYAKSTIVYIKWRAFQKSWH